MAHLVLLIYSLFCKSQQFRLGNIWLKADWLYSGDYEHRISLFQTSNSRRLLFYLSRKHLPWIWKLLARETGTKLESLMPFGQRNTGKCSYNCIACKQLLIPETTWLYASIFDQLYFASGDCWQFYPLPLALVFQMHEHDCIVAKSYLPTCSAAGTHEFWEFGW